MPARSEGIAPFAAQPHLPLTGGGSVGVVGVLQGWTCDVRARTSVEYHGGD